MNDKSKIVIGLIIFFAIITSPFWYNMGKAVSVPEPKLSDKAKAAKVCVESKEYMKTNHMHILDIWRNEVVRKGNRTYTNSMGKEYNISLSSGEESCLGCHGDKAEFCDKCHTYASMELYCWDCHINPKEKK